MAALRRLIPTVANSARVTVRKQSTAIIAESEKASLLKKAEGPWGEMSIAEKTNLYRAVYKSTRIELMNVSSGNQVTIFAIVAGSVAVSYGLFSAIHATIVGPTPRTMTAEYKAAEDVLQKDKNPITVYGTTK
eukprot:m.113842 g.113842  ORF g.113842 m.113842 type:complete len:133 (-) comp28301_c0_seq2:553-951(-)